MLLPRMSVIMARVESSEDTQQTFIMENVKVNHKRKRSASTDRSPPKTNVILRISWSPEGNWVCSTVLKKGDKTGQQHQQYSCPPNKKCTPADVKDVPIKEPSPQPAEVDWTQKLESAISPEQLPAALGLVRSTKPITPPPRPDSPVRIHNHSVEEYQHIYHEVVDDMLRYTDGRRRPYSLALGRRIKEKLWERLNRPTIQTLETTEGLLHVRTSYGAGLHPPHYNVDISGEPKPKHYTTGR